MQQAEDRIRSSETKQKTEHEAAETKQKTEHKAETKQKTDHEAAEMKQRQNTKQKLIQLREASVARGASVATEREASVATQKPFRSSIEERRDWLESRLVA